MRTLILDDEEPIVHMLAKVCEREGHTVAAFTRSVDALIHLASQPVDLLITDMQMPELDGIKVIREARRLQRHLFTLIITGHMSRYPIEDLLADGTADILFKPFHTNELRTRLALCERRRKLITRLHDEKNAVHASNHEMLQELENELAHRKA